MLPGRVALRRFLSTATARTSLKIGLIPADGIGKEVIPAARDAILALGSAIPKPEFIHLDAGFEFFTRHGEALPEETTQTLSQECDGALFGAVSSPSNKVVGYTSPIVALRKALDLYANIRPVLAVPKDPNEQPSVDMVVVRENTECLYVKQETMTMTPTGKEARATRLITERASRRIGIKAFELALARPRRHLTIIHKANVLSITDGLFRDTVKGIPSLPDIGHKYREVTVAHQIVDSAVYRLFREPQYVLGLKLNNEDLTVLFRIYDVMVAPNLYGDILSDAAAALVGSLGVVPSVNAGDTFVMGEPVHGSAPDIQGQNKANPMAAIRSAALMLRYLGYEAGADRIDNAVNAVWREGEFLTPDLGGRAGTKEVVEAIIKRI